MGRIIGIDYGTKRVGIAVTDAMQMIATSLATVHAKDVFDFLDNYLKNHEVECFVLGYPKDLMNRTTDATKHMEIFCKKLKERYKTQKIELVDERFTSKIAMQSLIESGVKKQKRRNKELLDAVSAVLILQTYLNKIKKQ